VLLALAAAVFFPTFALVLGLIGLLLVVPAFAWFNVLAGIERRRAGWVGEPVPVPQFVESSGGLFSSIRARLVDTARWRQLLFFALFVIVGPVLFALGSAPWGFVIGSIFDDVNVEIGLFGVGGLGSFLGALAFAGAAPRITLGAAWLAHAFTTALLGPTERAELQERVTELSDQRQQILDAVAGERRRIERNLHDGVQQQLVALGIDIGRANARIDSDPDGARQLLDEARDKVRGSIGELRLIGRGLHPAVLEDRGLDAALSAVVANAPIPITVEITCQATLAEDVASTAYYVANEAVANILKHSHARVASIRLADEVLADGSPAVRLRVHDDGRGGADIGAGSGLAGIRARVDGVDGQFHLSSPTGGPTTLEVVLPLDGGRRE
jgi:signal transduction histidine kinase